MSCQRVLEASLKSWMGQERELKLVFDLAPLWPPGEEVPSSSTPLPNIVQGLLCDT